MKILILFLMMISSALAASPEATAVKVQSSLSAAPQVALSGSATLFRKGTALYALTSEHVVVHSRQGHKITLQTMAGKFYSGKLVSVDYAYGLGLIQVEGNPRELNVPQFEELFELRRTQNGDAALVAGYPWASKTLLQDFRGRVVNAQSERHFIARAPEMIEIQGAQGEFGMSGSSVWNKQGKVIGVLSHQILRMVPGGATQIGSFSKDSKVVENHLLVIPASVAAAWVRKVLSQNDACVEAVRDPRLQLRSEESILIDGFRLGMSSRAAYEASTIGGGDGHGIGGGDGHGIGGGDGHGIGGGDGHGIGGGDGHGIGGGDRHGIGGGDRHGIGGPGARTDGDRILTISPARSSQWKFCKSPQATTQLKGLAAIESLVSRNAQTQALENTRFRSLDQAISLLLKGGKYPVPASRQADSAALQGQVGLSSSMSRLETSLNNSRKAPPVEYAALIRELSSINALSKTPAGLKLIQSENLIESIQMRQEAWDYFFADQFDLATAIWGTLETFP